ncbi:porin family protein [Geotalea toluenoxydans]|uniref:porin family protein n=1 Tax=Geotalea toluenoxydans TaxID=421624 RepID=UPI000A8FE80C|nr:porin family protein [Geotalea toluenoxydans]
MQKKEEENEVIQAHAVGSRHPAALGGHSFGCRSRTRGLLPLSHRGGYTFDGKQHLETQPVGGIRAGYNFTKYLGAEALFDYTRTEGTRSSTKTDFYRYGADALLHIFPDNKLVPYIAAGYSGMSLDSNDGTKLTRGVFDYGPGIKYFISDTWALRGDFRHLIFKHEGDSYSNYEYNLGLVYSFGAARNRLPLPKLNRRQHQPPNRLRLQLLL